MTGERESRPGRRADKVVRRLLADGTVKEYRYARDGRLRRPSAAGESAIRLLANLYSVSPEFRKLSARWQAAKLYYLDMLQDALGWMTLEQLQARQARDRFYQLRDANAGLPHRADKLLDTLKGLLGWAYERNKIEVNHALGIRHLAASGRVRSDIVWTEDDEAIVLASFPKSLQQAWHLALFTAARQSDLCALRWTQLKDGWLTFKPAKTLGSSAVTVSLPVFALAPLQALIDELGHATDYLLTTEEGLPWNPINLRARWRPAMAGTELAGADLHWHDIRGTAVTRMLEAGCTDAEVAAVTGHVIGGGSSLSEYAARTRSLALAAYQKWDKALAEGPKLLTLENAAGKRGDFPSK